MVIIIFRQFFDFMFTLSLFELLIGVMNFKIDSAVPQAPRSHDSAVMEAPRSFDSAVLEAPRSRPRGVRVKRSSSGS